MNRSLALLILPETQLVATESSETICRVAVEQRLSLDRAMTRVEL